MISHVERAGNLLDSGDSRDSGEGRGEIRDIGDELCGSGPDKLAAMTEEATPIERSSLVFRVPVCEGLRGDDGRGEGSGGRSRGGGSSVCGSLLDGVPVAESLGSDDGVVEGGGRRRCKHVLGTSHGRQRAGSDRGRLVDGEAGSEVVDDVTDTATGLVHFERERR